MSVYHVLTLTTVVAGLSFNEACLSAGTPFRLPKCAGFASTTLRDTFAATCHTALLSASTQASMQADGLHYLTLPFVERSTYEFQKATADHQHMKA